MLILIALLLYLFKLLQSLMKFFKRIILYLMLHEYKYDNNLSFNKYLYIYYKIQLKNKFIFINKIN